MVNKKGKSFTVKCVKKIRARYDIRKHLLDDFPDVDSDGRYSSAAVARMLKLHPNSVLKWCREGRLDGVKDKLEQRWWIKITPEEVLEIGKTIRQWPSKPRKSADVSEMTRLSTLLAGQSGVAPKELHYE
jgi:hypothetical protein